MTDGPRIDDITAPEGRGSAAAIRAEVEAKESAPVLGGLLSGIALALAMFLEALGYGIVAPTLPFLAQRFGAGEVGIGFLVSVYGAIGLVIAVPVMVLANRHGRRPTILFGLAALTFASIGFVFAPTYLWLVLARALQGVGGTAIWVGALTMAADLSPDSKMGRSLSWITGAWSLGFVIGPAMGGVGNVQTPFIIYAVLSGVAFVAGLAALPESGRSGIRTTFAGIVRVLKRPPVLASAAATFTLAFYYGAIEAFLPLMVHGTGVERIGIGLLFTVAGIPSIILPRLTGYLADRIGDVRLIVAGMVFATVLNASFLLLFDTVPHWFLFFLVGLVEVFVYVPAAALLNRGVHRDDRIFATGSHNYAFNIGFFLGPVLGGMLIVVGGYVMLFSLLTVLMVATIIAVLATRAGSSGRA
ncbi:MAG: MFS transporter [Acidobacteriota bacterium]